MPDEAVVLSITLFRYLPFAAYNLANIRYEADVSRGLLRLVAVRSISVGEELTINYNAEGGGAEWADDNWFDYHEIKPIVNR